MAKVGDPLPPPDRVQLLRHAMNEAITFINLGRPASAKIALQNALHEDRSNYR